MASKKKSASKPAKSPKPVPAKSVAAKQGGAEKARKAAIAEIQTRLDGKQPPTKPGAKEAKGPKRLSALNAAAKILADTSKPMRCKELIAEMAKRGLWTSPGGKTPEATLYASILREMAVKGNASRFKKVERGLFAATGEA